jgi:F0F1-type ATP synthase membrane subunit c/vacuolar-type H+-ATPase subunit K
MSTSNPAKVPVTEQTKAILGGILAGLTALGTALADERITSGEWVGVAVAAVGTYATVFGVRNGPRRG